MSTDFRDKAPVSAAEAATIILDGVRSEAWQILIGEDAKVIDAASQWLRTQTPIGSATAFTRPPERWPGPSDSSAGKPASPVHGHKSSRDRVEPLGLTPAPRGRRAGVIMHGPAGKPDH